MNFMNYYDTEVIKYNIEQISNSIIITNGYSKQHKSVLPTFPYNPTN